MSDEVRRKMLADYPEKDPNGSLRELVSREEPLGNPRNAAEEIVHALLPGDDSTRHPLYDPPNPYMYLPYVELKKMSQDRTLPPEQRRLASVAMKYKQIAQSGKDA